MDIKEAIKDLPASPGVYIMKGDRGEVLYVGKAANLKKRVSSYFYPERRLSGRLDMLVQKVSEIGHIPTSTSAEALIYENSLIKQLSPKYNVALKDDKSYPMLKLTVNEKFPRLFITRTRKDDGAIYYGPYTNVKLLREAVGILKSIFPLRTCRNMPKGLCLNYHIKQCMAPCEGKIDEAGYRGVVLELQLFLEGKKSELLKLLSEKMAGAARLENFEEAAEIRARIEALGAIKEKRISYIPADEADELKNVLGISGRLEVIEAFDVSNIMGQDAVGSMIYFYKGRPRKSEYRHFKIKTVKRIDDYSMMRELITRRYRRLSEESKPLPDLIVIDGGKGHLGVALGELEKLGLSKIPAITLAKEFEHIYLKDNELPLTLPRESKALHLLKRIRDEAHRFAISYHKGLLSKRIESSELDNIKEIGAKRRRELLSYFGSIDRMKKSKLEELMAVKGMNEKAARNVIENFRG